MSAFVERLARVLGRQPNYAVACIPSTETPRMIRAILAEARAAVTQEMLDAAYWAGPYPQMRKTPLEAFQAAIDVALVPDKVKP